MSQVQAPAADSPAIPPPPGTTPCFDDPFTLQPYQTLTVASSAIVTSIMLLARLYTKHFILRSVTFEDVSCMLGWASFIAFLTLQELSGAHGAGAHEWNLQYQQLQFIKKYNNYGDMLYSISLLCTKLSIMLLIRRVFCTTAHNTPYHLTLSLIFANTAFYTAFLVVPAAQCLPRSKIWNPTQPGKCVDIEKLYIASSGFNLCSDVAMMSVPLYLVWRLQVSVRRKVGISAIFCTGGLACIASTLRLIYSVQLTRTNDYTFAHFQSTMWAMAEIAFGLLCSCLIVLPRLYQHFCDITPYTNHNVSESADPRSFVESNGRSKREWVQLEARAESERRMCSREARLGDEVELDRVLNDGDVECGR